MNASIATAEIALEHEPLPSDQVVDGPVTTGFAEIPGPAGLDIGVWEHSVGVSTDIEADEAFVVIAGRATVQLADGTSLDFRPGDVGTLDAGTATTWTVHETFRKVYVLVAGDEPG